jgi:GR25 family glycosyltransferase involved in LPS biosynthesis
MRFEFNCGNTFCIALDSRWPGMYKRLNKIGIQVTKKQACLNNTDEFDDRLNIFQKACGQSHIDVWRMIYSLKLDYALIIEDDACFDKNWVEKTNAFFLQINSVNWDMLLLNASEPISILNQWTLATEQYLTGAYIISSRGVSNILNMFDKVKFSADWMTTRLQTKLNSYCYFPWIVIQEGKDSTIGGSYDLDHAKVLACLKSINYSVENYIM